MECKNCSAEVSHKYCSNCGQPIALKRIDRHYIMHEMEHILHLERGIFYTIKELALKPGDSVKLFIAENRIRLVKPVIFIIVTSLIYTIVTHLLHIEEGYVGYTDGKSSATASIMKWVQDHYGYANIIMGVFIAFWTGLFFKRYGYNFFEILILLCFVMGIAMLIFTVFAILQGLTHIRLVEIGGYVAVIYCTWSIGQFFDKTKPASYLKALGAYLLGMITSVLFALVLGGIADAFIKH